MEGDQHVRRDIVTLHNGNVLNAVKNNMQAHTYFNDHIRSIDMHNSDIIVSSIMDSTKQKVT